MEIKKNWVYHMRKGIQSMFPKRKDIPNEDFECNPKGECWCMDEEFPQLPSGSNDICYSPNEITTMNDNPISIKQEIREDIIKGIREDIKDGIRDDIKGDDIAKALGHMDKDS